MTFSKEMEAAMSDEAFANSLEKMETKEEVAAAFAAKGVDVEKEMGITEGETELSEDDLEGVAGGIAISTFVIAVSIGWKVGSSAGILVRALYDYRTYGNPYRSYSKAKVDGLLRKLNLI